MSKFTMQRSKNTVTANTFLLGGAYKCAVESARAYEGKIGKTAEGLFTVTFNEVETAEKFIKEWRASYATAHETYAPKSEPAQKPKASKGNSAPSTKEMTAEEEYNFCYDLAKANGKLDDAKVARHLGTLAKRAQAERDAHRSKPSSSKKSKGFDFSTIKGNTKSEKNKALHATLVGMGHADSRSPEYQDIWSARPWAN
jgi:hypothetical protein